MSSSDQTPPKRSTRSGRTVKAPVRYEPDPNIALEDDYSDTESIGSDEEGYEPEDIIEDEVFSEAECDEDEDEDEDENEDDENEDEDEDEDEGSVVLEEDSEMEDVLDWEHLTDNASDHSEESDED